MARTSRPTRTRSRTRNHRGSDGPRVLPWVLLSNATEIVRDRPLDVTPEDRGRLRALVTKAGGRGMLLSLRERSELQLIIDRANARQARPAMPTPLIRSRAGSRSRSR
jgi:hypothetical protein